LTKIAKNWRKSPQTVIITLTPCADQNYFTTSRRTLSKIQIEMHKIKIFQYRRLRSKTTPKTALTPPINFFTAEMEHYFTLCRFPISSRLELFKWKHLCRRYRLLQY
jgi:hypothetical protein